MIRLAPLDQRLLDEFQRDLPLVPRPFAAMAGELGVEEAEVITRLAALQASGSVARVGATVRPNTAGASTLAALAVPEDRIDEVAALVGAEPGINHSYLREDAWNLWFVATAPDAGGLAACLARIGACTGLRVLDLPLRRAFNIDLGFRLNGPRAIPGVDRTPDLGALQPGDRPILQALAQGLPLVERPFAAVADALALPEAALIDRIAALAAAGILTRVGVIVRHRAIGWRSNAMVVWDLPASRIPAAGVALARHPGVTLCYQRQTVPGVWGYGLFSMIHGQSRAQALAVLAEAAALPELAGADHRALFSNRCFKQTGALLQEAAA
ncbi:MAG: AsnC family transcriptional regulator [Paracoccaceae bacterium]|nr:AsnC family transcriptional regulator [Paracoccaceae bacterium]